MPEIFSSSSTCIIQVVYSLSCTHCLSSFTLERSGEEIFLSYVYFQGLLNLTVVDFCGALKLTGVFLRYLSF